MQQTQYYGYLKPESTDDVTPDPFNTNADAIDLAIHNLSTGKQDALSTSQMNAVNSGITTAKVAKLNALPTASELEDSLGKALTSTLAAGATTLTFTDSSITANSTVDVYTSVYGVSPTEITHGVGSLTLAFDSQGSDLSVKVVIK